MRRLTLLAALFSSALCLVGLLALLAFSLSGAVRWEFGGWTLLRMHSLERLAPVLVLLALLRSRIGERGDPQRPWRWLFALLAGLLLAFQLFWFPRASWPAWGIWPKLALRALAFLMPLAFVASTAIPFIRRSGSRAIRILLLPAVLLALVGLDAGRASFRPWAHARDVREVAEGAASRSLRHPVLLVGLDGATWKVALPLLERGELPNLARLIERGTAAPLDSICSWRETTKNWGWWSSVVWTTLATGMTEQQHGVTDFLIPEDGNDWSSENLIPPGPGDWQGVPFWETLGELGLNPSINGWWNTYPAHPFEGELVTLRLGQRLAEESAEGGLAAWLADEEATAGLAHPPDLLERRLGTIRVPNRLDEVVALSSRQLLDFGASAGTTPDKEDGLLRVVWQDILYKEFALAAIREGGHHLVSWYCEGTDFAQHEYWGYRFREPTAEEAGSEDPARLTDFVAQYYRMADRWLGELLEAAGDEWNILVVSDHGHGGGFDGSDSAHHHKGVLVAAGPDFRQWRWPRRHWAGRLGLYNDAPTVLDLVPTLLYLTGAPVGRDLPGRVLTPLLREETLANEPLRLLDRAPRRKQDSAARGVRDESTLERLDALGYIDAD